MKFTVSSAEFSERLQQVLHVMSSKPITPVFSFIKFDLVGNVLTLTGSDGDVTLKATLNVDEPEGEGSFLILGNQLSFLSKFGNQSLLFTIDERSYSLEIKSSAGKYNYIGNSATEFPNPRELGENKKEVKVESSMMLEGIARTVFAAGTDELRPIMMSVCMDVTDDGIYFVATDAHKLSMMKYTSVTSNENSRLIIPSRTASALKYMLAKCNGELSISFDANTIYVQAENYLLISRLVEGNYPNYKSVIPKDMPVSIYVNTDVFRVALDRVAACATASHLVRVSVSGNNIHLLTQDLDYSASGEENVECTLNGSEGLEFGINANLMLSILGAMNSVNEVEIKMLDATRPILVLPVTQNEGSELTMLLTPMTL